MPAGHSHEIYETREGASHRTADELVDIFLDAAEWYAQGFQRADYVPRDVTGWCEDPDDSQALHDEVMQGESALADVGLSVHWDDGFVIERVREVSRRPIDPDILREYRDYRRKNAYMPAKHAAEYARWILAEPSIAFGRWDDDWQVELERDGFTIRVGAGYDEYASRADWMGEVTDSRYAQQWRDGKKVTTYPYVPNEINPRAWYFDGSEMVQHRDQYGYVQLEYTREMYRADAQARGASKSVAVDYAAEMVRKDIDALTADYADYSSLAILYVTVSVYLEGTKLGSASLNGIDVDADKSREMVRYLSDVAEECISEALSEAREKLTALVANAKGIK